MHLRQFVLKKTISIFFVYFWFKPGTSIFLSGSHFTHRSGTVLAFSVEGHLSNIPMKFEGNRGIIPVKSESNWLKSLGGDSVQSKLFTLFYF